MIVIELVFLGFCCGCRGEWPTEAWVAAACTVAWSFVMKRRRLPSDCSDEGSDSGRLFDGCRKLGQ